MDIFLLTQRSAMEEDTQRFLKSHGKRNPIPSNVDNGFNSVVEEYKDTDISKSDKEIANHAEVEIADTKIDKNDAKPEKKDEMDQWVSDSFYSYFPGYTNEYQKRQEILRNRQRENQENFIKHQEMLQTSQKQTRLVAPTFIPSNQLDPTLTKHCSGSTANMPLLTTTLSNDKTDLEIIVTNPNYQPTKYLNSRPNTTRHKLLRDLSHTALSSNEDIYADRNERVEFETNRKKEYQRELMEQIEEKRRNVQLLREKEHMEDEALTRRLQEQLKTINLEEKLAKENVLAEKIRKDTEQNRLMRAQLLAKLENDTNLLSDNQNNTKGEVPADTGDINLKNVKCSEKENFNKNKVYKYFSNSARQDSRHSFNRSLYRNLSPERECFHLSEKICPKCDGPLKSYEGLNCQQRISTKQIENEAVQLKFKDNTIYCDKQSSDETVKADCRSVQVDGNYMDKYVNSFVLVCHKCERMYTLCRNCVAKNSVCRSCNRKLNVCMNCRRNLCNICLNEIATGQNTERTHRNDTQDEENPLKQGGNSFHIFNLNTTSPNIYEDSYSSSSVGTVAKENENSTCHHIKNNLSDEKPQLPAFDSIEIKLNKSDKYCYLDDDENSCIDSVRRETDRHLSRYLKNYGDVALLRIDKQRSKSESRHRGTQTINSNLKRRDIMLNEEHNLSMPLLREMPKMTRKQFLNFPEMVVTQRKRKIDCLKRKWEVPAVQKCIITQNSPYILTQVGAIRKQLQAECLADAQFNSDDSIS
uniref:Uncharacterized protein n=1 Tax=Zeugodacus cucurbitae TaxID=28588 RepID=A0A0A1WF48_ZEUCU